MSCGFDANFVTPLSEDHTCPICQLALREPRLTVCGHHYCEDCLRPLLSPEGVTCPICRTQLNESEIYPNNLLKRQILSLKVWCNNRESGCEWIGELLEQKTHDKRCDYMCVPCPRQCGETMLFIDVKKHVESCVRRRVNCCCGRKMEYRQMDDHLTQCEKHVVPCPYNCGSEMMREQLELHLSQQGLCPRVPVGCEFKDAGCQFKGEKIAVEEHIVTGVVSHVELMMNQLRELKVQHSYEANQRMLLMPPGQFIYVWRIENWRKRIADAISGRCSRIDSEQFYISHPGHCLYLKAYPNGLDVNASDHVSLFLTPTPGKYDGQVKWPFAHSYSLSVVDQQPRGEDKSVDCSPPYGSYFVLPTSKGWGHPRFVSHQMLSTHCYLKNNCIVVKVVVNV